MPSMRQYVVFSLLGVLAVLVAGELVVRTLLTLPSNIVPDAELGWMYAPNSRIFQGREGFAENQLDELGFNSESPDPSQPTTVFIGDSITEALQVERQMNFVSRVDRGVACRNFYNAARSGLSPLDARVIVGRISPRMDVDEIILVLNASDYYDMQGADLSPGPGGAHMARHRSLSRLRLMVQPVASRSALFTYLLERARQTVNKPAVDPEEAGKHPLPTAFEASRWASALSAILQDLKTAYRVDAFYVPTLDFLPDRQAVETADSAKIRSLFQAVLADSEIQLVNLADPLVTAYRETGQPPVGFPNLYVGKGHLNGLGHAAIAEWLMQRGEVGCTDLRRTASRTHDPKSAS